MYTVRFLNYAGDDLLGVVFCEEGEDITDRAPEPEVFEDLFMGMLILGGYHLGAAPFLRAFSECFATFSNLEMQHSPILVCNFR